MSSGNKSKRRGFATVDLFIVLFALALIGLLGVAAYRLLAGPAPWYVWLTSPLILPAILIGIGIFALWLDVLREHLDDQMRADEQTEVRAQKEYQQSMEQWREKHFP